MNRATTAVLFTLLVIASFWGLGPGMAADEDGPAPESGRYQVTTSNHGLYLCDTTTGQTWIAREKPNTGGLVWIEHVRPVVGE